MQQFSIFTFIVISNIKQLQQLVTNYSDFFLNFEFEFCISNDWHLASWLVLEWLNCLQLSVIHEINALIAVNQKLGKCEVKIIVRLLIMDCTSNC